MAENKKKKSDSKVAKRRKEHDGKGRVCFGILFLLIAVFLLIAFIGPYFGHTHDGKWLNQLGQKMSNDMFGIGTAYFIFLVGLLGVSMMVNKALIKGWTLWKYGLIFVLWFPIFLAVILSSTDIANYKFYGLVGYKCFAFAKQYIGMLGVILLLIFTALLYIIFTFEIKLNFSSKKKEGDDDIYVSDTPEEDDDDEPEMTVVNEP